MRVYVCVSVCLCLSVCVRVCLCVCDCVHNHVDASKRCAHRPSLGSYRCGEIECIAFVVLREAHAHVEIFTVTLAERK